MSGADGVRNKHSGPASIERRKKIAFSLEVSAVIGPADKSLPRVHRMLLSPSERIPSCFYPSSDPGSGRWADAQSLMFGLCLIHGLKSYSFFSFS